MRHFTLRDVFWLTLVVGVGGAWWVDHSRQQSEREQIEDAVLSDAVLTIGVGEALRSQSGSPRKWEWEFRRDPHSDRFRLVRYPVGQD
jgi:hypothetical protein